MDEQQGVEPIPTPKGRLPVLGDAREIRPATAIEDLMRLAREPSRWCVSSVFPA